MSDEWPFLRPPAAFALCATLGCDHQANSDVLWQPATAPPMYIPFCDGCIDARQAGEPLEFEMTVSGFMG